MAVNDAVDVSLKLLRRQLREAQSITAVLTILGGIMADKNADLQAALDGTQNTVDSVQTLIAEERRVKKEAADAQAALIQDLRDQLAAGPPGLTEAQVNAAIERLTKINEDILSTKEAPASGTPGETPVPVGP